MKACLELLELDLTSKPCIRFPYDRKYEAEDMTWKCSDFLSMIGIVALSLCWSSILIA